MSHTLPYSPGVSEVVVVVVEVVLVISGYPEKDDKGGGKLNKSIDCGFMFWDIFLSSSPDEFATKKPVKSIYRSLSIC